jgi:hypothetical protein
MLRKKNLGRLTETHGTIYRKLPADARVAPPHFLGPPRLVWTTPQARTSSHVRVPGQAILSSSFPLHTNVTPACSAEFFIRSSRENSLHRPHAAVRHKLRTGQAGRSRNVVLRANPTDSMFRGLRDRIGFSMDGANATAVFHVVSEIVAGWCTTKTSVVSSRRYCVSPLPPRSA